MTSEGAKNWPGQTTPAPLKILVVVAFFAVLHAGVLPVAASDDDPWAKLEDSPSMTCLDNEAELNRIWIDRNEQLDTKVYDKRGNFNFLTVNLKFLHILNENLRQGMFLL